MPKDEGEEDQLHALGEDSDNDGVDFPIPFNTPLSVGGGALEQLVGGEEDGCPPHSKGEGPQYHQLDDVVVTFSLQTLAKVQRLIASREKAAVEARQQCQQKVQRLGVVAEEALQERDAIRVKLKADPTKPNQKNTERKSEIIRLMQRRIDTLKHDVGGYKSKCETLERRVNLLNEQQRALLCVGATGKAKTPLEEVRQSLNERLEVLDLNCETVLNKCVERRVRVESMRPKWEGALAAAKAEYEGTKIKLVATEKEANRTAPKSSIVSMLNRRLAELKDDLRKRDDQISTLKARLDMAEDSLSTREANSVELQADSELHSEKWKAQLQAALDREAALQRQARKAQQVGDEAQFQVQQLQREREALRQQVVEQHSLLTSERCRTQSLIGEATAECRRREAEIFEAQHELQMRTEDIIAQQAMNAQLVEELSIVKRRVTQLQQEVQNLQAASPTTPKEPSVDFQAESVVRDLQFEVDALRKALAECAAEMERKEQGWNAKDEAHQSEVKRLQQAVAMQASRLGAQKGDSWEDELLSMAKRKSDIFFEKHAGAAGSTETDTDRVLKRRDANLEYLKNIILKFLTSHDDVQRTLFPVLCSLLQFNGDELGAVYKAHKDWKK